MQIAEIQKLLEAMMEQVREYSYELNPSAVERAGLRRRSTGSSGRIRERFTGGCASMWTRRSRSTPRSPRPCIMIAQEAVENAVQHSSCSAIEIAVKSTRTGPVLEVRDNGKGFDPADLRKGRRGLGLLSMEHYAAQAGMDLSIKSNREMGHDRAGRRAGGRLRDHYAVQHCPCR